MLDVKQTALKLEPFIIKTVLQTKDKFNNIRSQITGKYCLANYLKIF